MALTRQEKETFIKGFIGAVQETMLNTLPDVPEAWDGHELREWIADSFDWQRRGLPMSKDKKRMKDYRNEVIVKNLI